METKTLRKGGQGKIESGNDLKTKKKYIIPLKLLSVKSLYHSFCFEPLFFLNDKFSIFRREKKEKTEGYEGRDGGEKCMKEKNDE